MLITDGDSCGGGGGGAERVKTRLQAPTRKTKMPWTAARTTKVLRHCPLAIAQQLVYYAVAVSTVVRNRVTNTMSVAPLLRNN